MFNTLMARKLVSAFTESSEQWKHDHAAVQVCWQCEDAIQGGIEVFHHLARFEARVQNLVIAKCLEPDDLGDRFWQDLDDMYREWLNAAEAHLAAANEHAATGYPIEGLDEFRSLVAECRSLVENKAIDDDIPPLKELAVLAKPDNPRPERYTD
jgi:hypothetical protein